jgi:hypothetical protein
VILPGDEIAARGKIETSDKPTAFECLLPMGIQFPIIRSSNEARDSRPLSHDIALASSAVREAIALRCGDFPEETLRGATAIYDAPADLLAGYPDSLLAAS